MGYTFGYSLACTVLLKLDKKSTPSLKKADIHIPGLNQRQYRLFLKQSWYSVFVNITSV